MIGHLLFDWHLGKLAEQLNDDSSGLKVHEGHLLFHLSTESWTWGQETMSAMSSCMSSCMRQCTSTAEQCMEPHDATNSVFKLTNNEEQRIYTLC